MIRSRRPLPLVVVLAFAACDGSPSEPDPSRAFTPALAVTGAGHTTVVHPTGHHPTDRDAVQAAVDAGGSVLLKATDAAGVPRAFDFGPPEIGSGWVELTTDVTLTGESVAGARTTILGGSPAFLGLEPVRSAIRNVVFVGPHIAAVYLLGTAGFELSDSRVEDVVPFVFFTPPGGEPRLKGQAVWVQPRSATSLSGTISIVDNAFVDAGLGGAVLGYGLAILPHRARTVIARNVIRGANLAGIFLALNARDVVIEDNVIEPGPGDRPDRSWGNAVHVLGTTFGGTVAVRRNVMRVSGPMAHGVFVFGDAVFNGPVDRPVVEDNVVEAEDAFAGVGMWGMISDGLLERNRVSGSAVVGVGVIEGFFDPAEPAVANVLLANPLERLAASEAAVYLGANTSGHVVVGNGGDVLDLGSGNVITGGSAPPAGGVGRAIAEARERTGVLLEGISPEPWARPPGG